MAHSSNRPAHRCQSAIALCCLMVVIGSTARADEVAERIAALEAAGEPVTMEQVAPPPVAPDDNAALCYLDAVAALTRGGDEIYAALDPSDPSTVQRARDAVVYDSEALEWVKEGAAKERCRFDLNYSAGAQLTLPHLAKMRSLARFLRCAALASALDGDRAEAAERLRLGFVLARHVSQDPVLIGLLVTVAIDAIMVDASAQVMALGRIPTQQAQALSAEIGRLDYTDCLVRVLRTERCMGLHVFGQIRQGGASVESILAGGEGDKEPDPKDLEQYLQAGGLQRDELAYLDIMARAIERGALPWRQSQGKWPED